MVFVCFSGGGGIADFGAIPGPTRPGGGPGKGSDRGSLTAQTARTAGPMVFWQTAPGLRMLWLDTPQGLLGSLGDVAGPTALKLEVKAMGSAKCNGNADLGPTLLAVHTRSLFACRIAIQCPDLVQGLRRMGSHLNDGRPSERVRLPFWRKPFAKSGR